MKAPLAALRTQLPPHSPSLADPPAPSCYTGGSAGSPRTRSASQLMENVSSAALAPLGRTTDACSMGGREGREEPTGKNCLCMLSILTSSKGCGSVGSEHSAGCCFLRAFVLVEPVIHLPSPEQKDRVQCEFLARKAFTLCWGGRTQKSSVARGDGHPQLSKKHSSELSVPEKGKKTSVHCRCCARKSWAWVGYGVRVLAGASPDTPQHRCYEVHRPALVCTRTKRGCILKKNRQISQFSSPAFSD